MGLAILTFFHQSATNQVFALRQAKFLDLSSDEVQDPNNYFLPIRTMGTTTEKEIIDALASALEGMIEVLLYGRFDELNRKVIKAYNRAAAAMNLLERSPYGSGNTPE